MAVIAAAKLHNVIAIGDAARQAHDAHVFRAAGNETNFLQPRNGAIDQCGELNFKFVGDTVAGAALRLIANRFGDFRIRVTQEHRAP